MIKNEPIEVLDTSGLTDADWAEAEPTKAAGKSAYQTQWQNSKGMIQSVT